MVLQKMKHWSLVFVMAMVLAGAPFVVEASGQDWRIDSAGSTLSFSSVKNNDIAVGGTFSGISGDIRIDRKKGSADGVVHIDLGTLETGDLVRDNNIKGVFFGVTSEAAHPAHFAIEQIDGDYDRLFGKASVGTFSVTGKLEIRGVTASLTFPMTAVRQKNTIRLFTTTPAPVRFADFQLSEAAGVLKQVCAHDHLLELATVSAEFVLQAK